MSTEMTYKIESSSSDETYDLGERLGRLCNGGEVFVLTSDLGGGKTTFARGFAKGMGSNDVVSSPTFTVSQVYDGRDDLKIYHFDFYRLNQAGVVGYELAEVLEESKNVILVEWGDIIEEVLPPKRVLIKFDRVANKEDKRLILLSLPLGSQYLEEALI